MGHNTLIFNLKKEAARLIPGYFALVMATGIISIAAKLLQFDGVANGLFYINIVAYVLLWLLFILRLIYYFPAVHQDFFKDSKSPGFLTIVAGSAILGDQFITFGQHFTVAVLLFIFSLLIYAFLIYLLFTIIITKPFKPSLAKGLNGIWLLIVVSTASLSILSSHLAAHMNIPEAYTLFASLFLFLLGSLLYVIIITLIFYRLTFFKLSPKEFLPAYWINMGAVAILALAGTELLQHAAHYAFLTDISSFIKGLVLLFWVMGSWWIPLIIILDIWRYGRKSIHLNYHPQQWGMIFPIGMYTVCTYHLANTFTMDFLLIIPQIFIYVSFLVWGISFIGLLKVVVTGK